MPVQALSVLFRAKLCAGLKRAGLLATVPPAVWPKAWVGHCQPAGRGEQVLDYLGRYVFRVALSNSRLEQIAEGQVIFRYRDNRTRTLRRITLPGVDFLSRFLQHVLPRGCTKVRYYGLWSSTCRTHLAHARPLLTSAPVRIPDAAATLTGPDVTVACPPRPPRCPHCQGATLVVVAILPPHRSRSP